MQVRFLQTRTVQAVDGETFHLGEVYDLPETSAQRWISRGVAVAHDGGPAVVEAAAVADAPKKRGRPPKG